MLGAFSMVVLCIDLQLPYWLGILITLAALSGPWQGIGSCSGISRLSHA